MRRRSLCSRPACASWIVGIAVVTALAGCGKSSSPSGPEPPPAYPTPDSPANAVRLLRWSFENQDTLRLREALAGGFRFVFAASDSTGDPYPGRSFGRDTMVRIARNLFVGSPGNPEPAATLITFTINPNLIATPDTRDGKDGRVHKEILTDVDLALEFGARTERVVGYARFFLTRGDSALIPADLVARGFTADSTRWYVDGWEDQTGGMGGAMRARPVPASALAPRNHTLGEVLARYDF